LSDYFDTSFLAPLVKGEPTSGAITHFFNKAERLGPMTSHWTRAEFSSLIARDVRMKATDANTAARVESRFESLLSMSFNLLMPTLEDIELCKRYLQHYDSGLRAGDALHLAIARNNKAHAIYSLDDKMIRAGKLLGLPVSRGIRAR
jgi:uncharacterized protein